MKVDDTGATAHRSYEVNNKRMTTSQRNKPNERLHGESLRFKCQFDQDEDCKLNLKASPGGDEAYEDSSG